MSKVLVIGAGAAGLACAHKLISKYTVKILESSNDFGGRVKTLKGFAKVNLEAGGEEIHYKNTPLYNMCESLGANFTVDEDESL